MLALDIMREFGQPIRGIIHVGANVGQEAKAYHDCGAAVCVHIEPIPKIFAQLQAVTAHYPGQHAVRAVCSDRVGERVEFKVTNNTESSSFLGLGRHADLYPQIEYVDSVVMHTRTIDDIVESEFSGVPFDLLVVDAQGADLKVLMGARRLLTRVSGVFVEVSEVPLYEGGCTLDEINGYLRTADFWLKWLKIGLLRWGDAFYLAGRAVSDPSRAALTATSPNVALGKAAKQSSLSAFSRPNDAQGAVNGTRTGQFGFHTDLEDRPWWEVDLGRPLAIGEIRIFNRLDVGAERSRSLNVLLSNDGVSWRTVHDQEGRVFGGLDGRPLRIFPAAQEAQFVRVQLTERQYLHLDQVEVYEPLGEVAKVPPDSDEPTPEDGTAGSRRSPT